MAEQKRDDADRDLPEASAEEEESTSTPEASPDEGKTEAEGTPEDSEEAKETGDLDDGDEEEWDDDEYEWVDDDEEDDDDEGLDLERRFLCSDGACIGVIGSDGTCKVCGAPLAEEDRGAFEKVFVSKAGGPPKAAPEADDGEDEEASPAEAAEEAPEEAPVSTKKKKKADFSYNPDARVLCSDGACIGLIGPDGTCKECGKAYEGEAELD